MAGCVAYLPADGPGGGDADLHEQFYQYHVVCEAIRDDGDPGFSGNIYWVATDGNDAADGIYATPWETITNAEMNVVAGNVYCGLVGEYEWCDRTPGTAGWNHSLREQRIAYYSCWLWGLGSGRAGRSGPIGRGRVLRVLRRRKIYYMKFCVCVSDAECLTGITNRNWYFCNGISNIAGAIQLKPTSANAGANHAILNCWWQQHGLAQAVFHLNGVTNAIIDACIQTRCYRQCDFCNIGGINVWLTRNYDYMSGSHDENHIDFFMFLGNATNATPTPCTRFRITQNWIESLPAYNTEICSTSTYATNNPSWTNGWFWEQRRIWNV